jgi:hypothetical protein
VKRDRTRCTALLPHGCEPPFQPARFPPPARGGSLSAVSTLLRGARRAATPCPCNRPRSPGRDRYQEVPAVRIESRSVPLSSPFLEHPRPAAISCRWECGEPAGECDRLKRSQPLGPAWTAHLSGPSPGIALAGLWAPHRYVWGAASKLPRQHEPPGFASVIDPTRPNGLKNAPGDLVTRRADGDGDLRPSGRGAIPDCDDDPRGAGRIWDANQEPDLAEPLRCGFGHASAVPQRRVLVRPAQPHQRIAALAGPPMVDKTLREC